MEDTHQEGSAARSMRAALRAVLVATAMLVLSSCVPTFTVTVPAQEEPSAGGIRVVRVPREAQRGMDVQLRDGKAFHVPPGHLPPPGMCRIWLPGTPPGHQPPPGDCEELEARVPPEAVLLRR